MTEKVTEKTQALSIHATDNHYLEFRLQRIYFSLFFLNFSYCYFEFSVNMQSQQMFFSPTKYKALSGKADGEISPFYTNARGFCDDALNAPRS